VTPMRTRELLDVYPLTGGQQGLLVEALSTPGPPLYLQHYVLELAGVPDEAVLRAGLAALATRHDVLRTSFVWGVGDQPLQVVRARAEVPLTTEETAEESIAGRLGQLLEEERRTPFDLTRPPLLRVRALHVPDGTWRLVMTHHHLILDGWSVPLLHDSLREILAAQLAGRELAVPTQRPFREFVVWEAAARQQAADTGYLARLLGDITQATPLGGDLPRRLVVPGSATASSHVTAERPVSPDRHPDRAARRRGLRPAAIVHAAWALLLARWSGVSDVVFGSTVSGRPAELPGITERLGMFVGTAVLRITVSPAPLGEWLRDVQRHLDDALDHEHASAASAQHSAALPPGERLLSSVLAFQNQRPPCGRDQTGEAVQLRMLAHAERTGLPLALSVALPDDRVWVRLSHDPGRVGPAEARWLADTLARLITELAVLPPTMPLTDVPVVSPHVARARTAGVPDELCSALLARLCADSGRPAAADADRHATGQALSSAVAHTAGRLRRAAPDVAGQTVVVPAPAGIALVTGIVAAVMCRAFPLVVDPCLPAPELAGRLGNGPVLSPLGPSLPASVPGPVVEIADGPRSASPPLAVSGDSTHPLLEGLAFGVELACGSLELSSHDRVLAVLAPDDRLTPTVILAALAAGSQLDLRDPADPAPPDGATVLVAAPAVAAGLVTRTAAAARVVLAGDPPPPGLVAEIAESGRVPWRLWASGRTGGADACTRLSGPSDALSLGPVLGGRIADEPDGPVPPGRSGELELVLPSGACRAGVAVRRRDVGGDADEYEQLGQGTVDEVLAVEQVLGCDGTVTVITVQDSGSHAWLGCDDADPAPVIERARHHAEQLPARCRPSEYTVLRALPVGRDGAVNRQALAAALTPRADHAERPAEPSAAALPAPAREEFRRRLRALASRGPRLCRVGQDALAYSVQQKEWQAQTAPARGRVLLAVGDSPDPQALAHTLAAHGLPATAVTLTADGDEVVLAADPGWLDAPALALLAEQARAAVPAQAQDTLTYADYAGWQACAPRAPARAEHLSYWRSALAGATPVAWPPPPAGTHQQSPGARADVAVTAEDTAWIAAAATALAMLAGREDVVLGAVTRPELPAEAKDIAGPFSRTLPVRVTVMPGQSFAGTRAAVAAALSAARAHPDTPWAELTELLGGPLAVSIAVHSRPGALVAHGDVAIGLDVAPAVQRAPGRGRARRATRVAAVWAPGRAVRADAERLRDLTIAVLRRGMADDASPLPAAGLVDPAMRRQLLRAGAGGRPGPALAASVPEAIARRARRAPRAIAVEAADGALTYAELVGQADRLAQRLRSVGIAAGDHVAACLPRRGCLVWGLLGIMTAGAVYVPVSADDPDDRLRLILAGCAARAVVTTTELADRFPGLTVLTVDELDELPGPALAVPARGPLARSCAYVLYTSGSTGEPKGVMVEHHSVVSFSAHIARAYQIGPGTRLLAFAPPTFDISVFEFWAGLSAGATVVLAGDDERRSADALQEFLERHTVDAAELPPSLMPLLNPGRLPQLRLVSVGGEAPAGALVDDWATDTREFWNGYGPTETTVAVTLMRCTRPSGGRVPPIGRAMPGHRAYVVDDELRLVPAGVTGELCVSGPGLARGYLGQPGATASRFVPDPYGAPGSRMYRTGDLARWTVDGVLEFAGRADGQIKIRGFRIEPAEVEAALADDPAVSQTAVAAWDDADGTRHLAAYVVPADPADPPDLARLREGASRRLAPYMLPTRLVVLAALPLTGTGKLDRARLPAPDAAHDALGEPDTAAWSETERVLAREVIGPLLGRSDVSRDEGFFHAGGNSLQAMQVAARVRDRFGAEISLLDFFSDPTITGLAAFVESAGPAPDRLGTQATAPKTRYPMTAGARLPLSYPQAALYASYQTHGDKPAYHAPLAVRVHGELDLGALRKSFNWLIDRHPAIRVTVDDHEGEPVQRVHPAAGLPVEVSDIPEGQEQTLGSAVGAVAARPFDLSRELPSRLALHRLGHDDHVIQWTLHHLVIDGWSLGVLARELSAAYDAFAVGSAPTAPPPACDYGDFVAWHRNYVSGPGFRSELAWWRGHLARAGMNPEPRLPAASDLPEFRCGWLNLRLPADTAAAVRELIRARGITLYMACLAAQAILLSAQTGSDDHLIVTPHSLRVRSEWEQLVGWFVNRVIVRVRPRAGWSFAELVDSVRDECAAVFARGSVPFELLCGELGLPGHALPVQLSVQNAPASGVALRGLNIRVVTDDSGRDFAPLLEVYSPASAWFQLSIVLRERLGGLIAGGFEYDATLVSEDAAQRWRAAFLEILAAGARAPQTTVGQLARVAQ
jgi:amino acid adenylation domain-containing protein